MSYRIGTGYDSHAFGADRPLILGGVTIEHTVGLIAHSDGDALCHALTDAILGAAALGDIGRHFPDTDDRWKDADSLELLRLVVELAAERGFRVVNLDANVVTQQPRLAPYVDDMRSKIAAAVNLPVDAVSVKAKTNEGMDAVGKGEGLIVHAIAALESV